MSAWMSGILASNHGADSSGPRRAGAAATSEPMPVPLVARPNAAAALPAAAAFSRFLRLIFGIGTRPASNQCVAASAARGGTQLLDYLRRPDPVAGALPNVAAS